MEEPDFDKRFADKMRHAGAPDFSDEDWERLHPLLDAQSRRHWRAIPLWWLGVLSGLLLCSNLLWWWMWRQSEQNSNALRTEWQQVQQKTETVPDTNWKKVVVYQYDTVYRTIVYRSVAESSATDRNIVLADKSGVVGTADKSGAVSTADQAVDSENTVNQLLTTGKDLASSEPQALSPNTNDLAGFEAQILSKDSMAASKELEHQLGNFEMLLSDIAFLEIPDRKLVLREPYRPVMPLKRARRPQVLIPRKFRIGAGAGFVLPQSDYLSANYGYQANISGEIAFSEQLALTLEGAFGGVSFRGTEYRERLGLPPHNAPGVDYALQYFETEEGIKPIVQFTLGMRYWIVAARRFSPYLGLGYAMQWHPSYELKLEYKNQVSGLEKESSVDVPFLSSPVSLLDLNAGVRYRFFKHWRWQTGLSYQFKLDANQPGIPRFWGLKSAILYEF